MSAASSHGEHRDRDGERPGDIANVPGPDVLAAAAWQALMERSGVAFALVDRSHCFLRVNRALAEICARTAEGMIGRSLLDSAPGLAAVNQTLLDHVAATEETVTGVEITGDVPATPGRVRTWIADYHPVTDDGVLIAVAILVVEVTERRALERLRSDIERRHHRDALRDVRRSLANELEAVRVLQDAVIPDQLPHHESIEVDARYLTASRAPLVGGDWYDVVPLPGGTRSVIIVGDVAGHGVMSARRMLQLRHWSRLLTTIYDSPADVLRALNRAMRVLKKEDMATVLVATFDVAEQTLVWSSAGHLPLVVRRRDRTDVLWSERADPPIGVLDDLTFADHHSVCEPGDVVVAYTDGLVERRDEPIDDGVERLRALVAGTTSDPAKLCDEILETLASGPDRFDDTCVVAVRALR